MRSLSVDIISRMPGVTASLAVALERKKLAPESFDIRQQGLLVHGTYPSKLSGIFREGLHLGPVWFNVTGCRYAGDDFFKGKTRAKMGFGEEEHIYGRDEGNSSWHVYLVLESIKLLFPEFIDAIVKECQDGVFGALNWIAPRSFEHNSHLIPNEAYSSKSFSQNWLDIQSGLTDLLLSHVGVSGLVIPDMFIQDEGPKKEGIGRKLGRYSREEILRTVIEIQEEVLSPEGTVPIYSFSGECLYQGV